MKTVLVVDDSRIVRKVARRILEGLGFAVDEAENGAEALAACRSRLPDGILLDWNMPVMNGIEFLHALRSEFGLGEPRVVFCTTESELDAIQRAIEGGANEYIMKPFDAEIIESKFQQVGLL
ncbi:response regulator [Elioraea thermophila]|uniref:response regulator n=1 Tax=Elioraea thermophila TaxID=2185104 RepID=UPI000DF3BEAA|nr:response regulator [Elioraea thermophila]MCS6920916.1 response regulator [Elioraea sp.]